MPVLTSLRYTTARLDALSDCVCDVCSFHAAAIEIRTACNLQQNITQAYASAQGTNSTATNFSRPTQLVRQGSGLSETDELTRHLRALDLEAMNAETSEAQKMLVETYLSRMVRTQAQYSAAENAAVSALGEYLDLQRKDAEKALATVYGLSPFTSKNLGNPLLTKECEDLEALVGDAGAQISNVEATQRNPETARARIIKKKWSR